MEFKDYPYYALGMICYAVAKSDGTVQYEEKQKLQEILDLQLKNNSISVHYSEIIFKLLTNENADTETVLEWAKNALETGKHHITDEKRVLFMDTVRVVAEAFPPTTGEEQKTIEAFELMLNNTHVQLPLD